MSLYAPTRPEDLMATLLDIERRLDNVEGVRGKRLSSEHENYLKTDGSRYMTGALDMDGNEIVNAKNPVLSADVHKGKVFLNSDTNQFEVNWGTDLDGVDTDDVPEGSANLYYTDVRARASQSATYPLEYDSSTGVHSSPAVLRSEKNIMLNAFRIAVNGSIGPLKMVDAFTDEFEDESGVDTAASTNESYDATDDFYKPTSTQGSALLDGTGDSLSVPDHADWAFGSGDFTMDLWVRLGKLPSTANQELITQWSSTTTDYSFLWRLTTDDKITFYYSENGSTTLSIASNILSWSLDTWYHLAVVRNGTTLTFYRDGVDSGGGTITETLWDTADSLYIGSRTDVSFFQGHMDEIRISKGIARWTANFTPPTSKYSSDANTQLLLHCNGPDGSTTFTDDGNTGHTVTANGDAQIDTAQYKFTGITDNMTLISNAETAESQPDDARIFIWEEDVDAITLNTDLKGSVSRDGGTTFSQATLASEGDYETGKQILSGSVDISAQPAGTSMVYKIETLNNKDLKLHGVGLSWR